MHRGFTLVELVIVIGVLAIIAGLSFPFLQTSQTSSELTSHQSSALTILRRAQQQAISGQEAKPWGVFFDSANHSYTLFEGSSYAERNQSRDLIIELPESVSLSTDFGDEVIFGRYNGLANVSGTITLSNVNSQSVTIFINSYGRVEQGN